MKEEEVALTTVPLHREPNAVTILMEDHDIEPVIVNCAGLANARRKAILDAIDLLKTAGYVVVKGRTE